MTRDPIPTSDYISDEAFQSVAAAAVAKYPPVPFDARRLLSDREDVLLARLTAANDLLGELVYEINEHLVDQAAKAETCEESRRLARLAPNRLVVLAVDNLRDGFMKLQRAVEQPSSF